MFVETYARIKNHTKTFLRCNMIYSAFTNSYREMFYFVALSNKTYFLSLLVRIWMKTHFPSICPIINFYQSSSNSFLVVLLLWITENNDVLSANTLAFYWRTFGRSLIYIRKSNGLMIEPWEIHALTLAYEETCPFNTTPYIFPA